MDAARRTLPGTLSALLVLALALSLASCAATSNAPGTTESTSGPWSFTDDLGKTVTLDRAPTKVAGLSDVLYALMNYGVKPVAGFGYSGIEGDVRFDSLDTTQLTEVGASYGEIDIEALAKAAPDVIVTNAYPVDSTGKVDPKAALYGFKDLKQQELVEEIAPIVTITMAGSAADVIKRTTELAVALGASADAGPIVEGRAAFDTASAKLTAAAEKGVVTQVLYAEASNAYVAKAADDPSLKLYQSLGMKFVPATTKSYYWDVLSWEVYGSVGGDVVLYSQRGFDKTQLMKQPTFAATPAAKAGQVYPWVFAGMDYVSQAAYIDQLAGQLAASKKVT